MGSIHVSTQFFPSNRLWGACSWGVFSNSCKSESLAPVRHLPRFDWVSESPGTKDVREQTLKNTTQWNCQVSHSTLKSIFPCANISHRNENVATDIFYSNNSTIYSGETRKIQDFKTRDDIYQIPSKSAEEKIADK